MIKRCYDYTRESWHCYGGKGVKVCERWRGSFEAFLEDMGECPVGLTIDRKDGDGDYEPGNCRWATRSDQSRNRNCNRWFTVCDQRFCMAELAEIYGINMATVLYRIDRLGWAPEDAFSKPLMKHYVSRR
jgi:hypothetical protein